ARLQFGDQARLSGRTRLHEPSRREFSRRTAAPEHRQVAAGTAGDPETITRKSSKREALFSLTLTQSRLRANASPDPDLKVTLESFRLCPISERDVCRQLPWLRF